METVIDLCRSVREKNPDIFLNITSGTWLSPWWLKYTNTIWMQGHDYGYSEIPSISRRDAAITYRDYVLYDDLIVNDFWFPIANLMTHGIIKGHLQMLGGTEEPLDKFTDNALLYFARGISMWELYISPDILKPGEWNAISKSIHWAKSRFPILSNTYLIGGNPKDRKAYGYIHIKGNRGIIAARNPFIESTTLEVKLTPWFGLKADASLLIFEQTYPTRWISPQFYNTGDIIKITLSGYETAIYEIYPLEELNIPLLAGVNFYVVDTNEKVYTIKFFNANKEARILNPDIIESINYRDENIGPDELKIIPETHIELLKDYSVKCNNKNKCFEIDIKFNLHESSRFANLSILLEPYRSSIVKDLPELSITLDNMEVDAKVEKQDRLWAWYKIDVMPGEHSLRITITPARENEPWTGNASIWIVSFQKQKEKEISFELKNKIKILPMPPSPWKKGEIKRNIKLGEIKVYI